MCIRLGRLALLMLAMITMWLACPSATARNFTFETLTGQLGGPSDGRWARINNNGDVAFVDDGTLWFYDQSESSFLNVSQLPGGSSDVFFLHANNNGDIAFVETTSRDLWLFEAQPQEFTNISQLQDYPGNSQAHFPGTIFDLNDSRQISFHSGDLNFGTVHVYDHASGNFEQITGKPGGTSTGRENDINNAGQVAYMGFPMTYLYDPLDGSTTNINLLPGGFGSTLSNIELNDRGDVASVRGDEAYYYEASSGTFLDLTVLLGWKPDVIASSDTSGLSNNGEITFWRDEIYYFNSADQSFTQLNGVPGGPPVGPLETSINDHGQIVIGGNGWPLYLITLLPTGDYNRDGNVDAADYTVWRDTLGQSVPVGNAADGSGDGIINLADYDVWKVNFGAAMAGSLYSARVPEPGGVGILWCAAMLVVALKWQSARGWESFRSIAFRRGAPI